MKILTTSVVVKAAPAETKTLSRLESIETRPRPLGFGAKTRPRLEIIKEK